MLHLTSATFAAAVAAAQLPSLLLPLPFSNRVLDEEALLTITKYAHHF